MTTAPPPRVSVVVPFFNAAAYLERCIGGLLAQRFDMSRVEILMVDNNSTDGGAAIVRRHPEIRLLHEPKQGAYAARNRALREARGEWIAFTDPDCVPEPDWLTRLLAPLDDPEVQVVNGRTVPDSRSRMLDLLAAYEHHRDLLIFGGHDPTLFFGHTNNLATRRGLLTEQGGFLERFRGSDAIFVRRVVDRYGCASVRYEPAARVLHLEIDGVGAHMRKVPVYRTSRESFREVAFKRTPTTGERVRILGRAVRAGDIPLAGAVPTVLLLAASSLYGRIAPHLARWRPSAASAARGATATS